MLGGELGYHFGLAPTLARNRSSVPGRSRGLLPPGRGSAAPDPLACARRIFSVLSAILYLGNITYKKRATGRDEGLEVGPSEVLDTLSQLLKVLHTHPTTLYHSRDRQTPACLPPELASGLSSRPCCWVPSHF